MKVKLDDNLINYMHDHHKHTLTLKLVHDDYSGYDIFSKHPKVSYHQPRHPENYNTFTANDITLYVEKGIRAKEEELLFKDEKVFGTHHCKVSGIAEVKHREFTTYGPD